MFLILLALVAPPAAAAPGGIGAPGTSKGRVAEYQRLADELSQQSKRNNWIAVERLYLKLDEMGQPHTRRVLINAAHAASDQGDVAAVRERLTQAQQILEEDETAEWLWRLQQEYGPALLTADLPMNYRLDPAQMPFSPEQRKAVLFAQQQIVEQSYFRGYLPRGKYTFAPYMVDDPHPDAIFTFVQSAQTQRFERRTRDTPTRRDRRKRSRIDRRIARLEGQ